MKRITFIGNGRYYATEDGHIYDFIREQLVSECLIKSGYLIVHLRDNGKSKIYTVHRIIGRVFCDGYRECLDINHKNGNKTDNKPENLEWVTRSENLQHAYKIGLRKSQKGEKRNSLAKGVTRISDSGEEKKYRTLQEAADDSGVFHQNISKVLSGKRKHAGGFQWRRE